MKGIVLAGGTGSRLWPITKGVSKQLLPVYDKPLIHYPIGTLFLAGIRDILIITTEDDLKAFKRLLGDGSQYGANFQYSTQAQPKGIAEAFIIGEEFIGSDPVALILGDNIFHGVGLGRQLREIDTSNGGVIFAYSVSDPDRYGVVEFGINGKVESIEEKPVLPKSNFAIPGLYFYDNQVVEIAKSIRPSPRGELEITDINMHYLKSKVLNVKVLERGTTWMDTGTFDSLQAAATYIQIVEQRQGLKISCLEEISYRFGWISKGELLNHIKEFNNPYGDYLRSMLDEK